MADQTTTARGQVWREKISRRLSASTVARLLLPPIVLRLASRLGRAEWEYVADHWPRDDSRSFGWDDFSVVEILRQNWIAYDEAVKGSGPLAFWPWFTARPALDAHNVVVTWAYVLARAARGKSELSVLDWGGAVGNYAVVGKALLPEVRLVYTVKERPAICAAGRYLLPEVSFTASDDECFSRSYDVVMASNSLQYAEDWRSVTLRLARATGQWLFITCLPVVHRSRSFVVVQRPQRHGLKADYISWVLNYDEFVEHVKSSGLVLERVFLTTDATHYRKASESSQSLGFLFRRG